MSVLSSRLSLGVALGVSAVLGMSSLSAQAADETVTPSQDQQMHKDLDTSMHSMQMNMMSGMKSNNPDVAFVKGMLPHHEGAVSMAQVELKYGKDPEMRQLARNIIKAQKREIVIMNQWLKMHGQSVK